MKKYILPILLLLGTLLTGCMKEDIDELRKQQAQNAERIKALEMWQTTINSNIGALQQLVTALQDNNFVTNVTQFATPAPGGYRITFSKSGEATIWNGSAGAAGATGAAGASPTITVEQFSDGKYYWKVNGTWMDDGSGNKVPVTGDKGDTGNTGTNGVTPKVIIGSNGFWYISADGTATGTAPGSTWVSTGVNATGATGATGSQGAKGDPGDAIFAADGVDYTTYSDYVEFTLADGVTKIRVPKYTQVGISFTQPLPFTAGTPVAVPFSLTNQALASSTNIRIVDVPAGWKVTVDMAGLKFTVTPPSSSTITESNAEDEATILVAIGNELRAMYSLQLRVKVLYQLGYYYPNPNVDLSNPTEKAKIMGIVYSLAPGTGGEHGMIVSLDELTDIWGPEVETGATSYSDGLFNMAKVYANNGNSFANYPIFLWAAAKNPSGTTYNSGAKYIWYIPSYVDMTDLFLASVAVNPNLNSAGGVEIYGQHLSSTEYNDTEALMEFAQPISKSAPEKVRAIMAF